MKTLRINLGENSYDILLEKGSLSCIGKLINCNGGKVFVITDQNVANLYLKTVEDSLAKAGYMVQSLVLPAGEKTKSFENLKVIYDKMLSFGLTRKDVVIALGGGVIGDLTGFASSTYLRGVDFVQIPTSLLAQVDSSVGGKVAVDLPQGKNLVGSFYQPKLVLIDPDLLNTLPDHYYRDGMGEIIKYGCIKDKNLFDKLCNIKNRQEFMSQVEEIIYICCDIKRQLVELDERDNGERMLLNFGHTYGHALEKYYNFEKLSHGEAVAIGMALVTEISQHLGLTNKGTSEKVNKLIENFGLPIMDIVTPNEVINAIANDKKNMGDKLMVVLIKEIGQSFLYPTNKEFFKTK